MIDITYGKHEIEIKGHAQSAESGKDLVCCAVSTLFFSLAENLQHITLNRLEIISEKGHGKIKAVTWTENRTVDTMFDFTIKGLQLIEAKYPQYVKISVVG